MGMYLNSERWTRQKEKDMFILQRWALLSSGPAEISMWLEAGLRRKQLCITRQDGKEGLDLSGTYKQ